MLWRRVKDFPDYEVSETGSLRSWRSRCDGRGPLVTSPKPVTGTLTPFGYTAVILRKPGSSKPYRKLMHRLVAEAFIPNPLMLPDVAHCDGNPGNNSAGNLRRSTHFDNQMDMRQHGTMQDGEICVTAKLTEAQTREIIRRKTEGGRGVQVRLAKEYGISTAQVSKIVNRKQWKHLDA